MEIITLFSAGLFDAFAQAALVLQDGAISACNAAAHALGLREGDAVPHEAAAPGVMELELAGKVRRVRVQTLENGIFLVVLPDDRDEQTAKMFLSVANALQTPLTTLLGASGELMTAIEEMESPRLQRSSAVCTRAVYQLLRLREHLCEFGGGLEEEWKIEPEKVELCGFFREIYEKTEPLCAELGVTLTLLAPQRQFYGWIDRKKLERAVYELLSNALKYTPRGGEIRLELTRQGEMMIFRCTDSGNDRVYADLAGAFTGYTRFSPLADSREGVGLGLPLVQKIVQHHGGRLLLEERAGGVSAAVALPLSPAEEALQLKSPVRTVEVSGARRAELIALADVLPVEVYDSRNL